MKQILFFVFVFFVLASNIQSQNAENVNKSNKTKSCEPYQNENICLITIDSLTFKNRISWENTQGVGTAGFIIYKETSTNIYDSIGHVDFNMASKFIDYASNPEMHSDRYKMCVVDSCGNLSQKSPYHQTIHLQVTQGYPNSTIILNWTKYFDESGVFIPSRYYIYRGSQPDNLSLLDSVSGSQSSYNDLNVFSVYYYGIVVKREIPCNSTLSYIGNFSNVAFTNISIFPNPFNESTTIKINNPDNKEFLMIITDASGRIVRKIDNVIGSEILIERNEFVNGLYFVQLTNEYSSYRGKIIIE